MIESDTPCLLEVSDFNIAYQLYRQSMFSGDGEELEKKVLKFTGERIETQEICIKLPGNAKVTSAALQITEDFQSDRLLESDDHLQMLKSVQMPEQGAADDRTSANRGCLVTIDGGGSDAGDDNVDIPRYPANRVPVEAEVMRVGEVVP